MFEISLVPEVKAKLLHQERVRNFVVFICIIVAAACVALILVLAGVVAARTASSNKLTNQISCMIEGKAKSGNCNGYGNAIMSTANLNEMLSIQNELNNIGTLNMNKTKPSRLLPSTEQLLSESAGTSQAFSMLEIALPGDAEYTFQTSEFSVDFENSVMNYDVVAHAVKSNSQATAYVNFKNSINGSYFDYGEYMRTLEDGSVEAIPTYCIKGEKIIDGQIYGIYNRYAPGCEAPMVSKSKDDTSKEGENTEEEKEVYVYHDIDPIYIRRSYKTSDDFEKYKAGENRSKNGEIISVGEAPKGFYFESSCVAYGDDGKFSEDSTRTNCPVATEVVEGTDKGTSRSDSTGQKVFTFSVSIPFTKEIFSQSSHNVMFFYPSRKTVSTSYVAIEDFFTNPVDDSNSTEDK